MGEWQSKKKQATHSKAQIRSSGIISNYRLKKQLSQENLDFIIEDKPTSFRTTILY
jgi:cytochrome c-type biogenesis protein CcmE